MDETEHAERILELCAISASKLGHGFGCFEQRVLLAARDREDDSAHRPEERIHPNDALSPAQFQGRLGPFSSAMVFLRQQKRANAIRIHSREALERKTSSFPQQRESEIQTRDTSCDLTAEDPQLAEAHESENFFRALRIAARQ